jgi:hypothetical protein
MHRIDGPGHIGNRFTAGNPAAGQQATRVTAEWLNDVQENILEVLEQAGIVPVKGVENQLYLAIVAIAAGAGGGGGGGDGVPTTRQINSAGLLVGGGALANDLNLNVPKANGAEVAAGLDDSKAVTPAGLVAAMASSKGTIGYTKLFNGFILMWGTATAAANTTTIVTLPTTFPTACAFAGCEGGNQIVDANDNNPTVVGRGTGSISIYNAVNSGIPVNWFTLGY